MARQTETATAAARIRAYARSRWRAFRTFESLIPSRSNASGRMTAAATRGPARAPRPASSAPAMSRNPWARSRRSYRSRSRSGPVTLSPRGEVGAPGQAPEARGRPDDDERLAHYAVDGDVAQSESRVVRVGPVVSEHEQLTGRHVPHGEALWPDVLGSLEIGLVQLPSVDVDVAVGPLLHAVTGEPDHSLDEVLVLRSGDAEPLGDPVEEPRDDSPVGLLPGIRVPEHDHVATPGRVQVVHDLVHENAVTGLEGRFHRLRRYVERLDEKGLDEQGEDKGDDDEGRQLLEEAERPLALPRLGLSSASGRLLRGLPGRRAALEPDGRVGVVAIFGRHGGLSAALVRPGWE